jgi:hypothetical protein
MEYIGASGTSARPAIAPVSFPQDFLQNPVDSQPAWYYLLSGWSEAGHSVPEEAGN